MRALQSAIRELIENGEPEKVESVYLEALHVAPYDLSARYEYVEFLSERAQWPKVIEQLKLILTIEPGNEDALTRLKLAEEQQKLAKEKQAAQKKEGLAEAAYNRGIKLANQGHEHLGEALKEFWIAYEKDSHYKDVISRIASTEKAKRQFDNQQQIENLLVKIDKDPRKAQSYGELGKVYYEEKKFAEAETVLRQALQLEPDNLQWIAEAAKVTYAQMKWSEAVELFTHLLKLQPENRKARELRDNAQDRLTVTSADRKYVEDEERAKRARAKKASWLTRVLGRRKDS